MNLPGEIIIPRNTVIDDEIAEKLKNYRIVKDIFEKNHPYGQMNREIWEKELLNMEDQAIMNGSIPYLPEKERQTYVNFKNAYHFAHNETKDHLQAIGGGKPPQITELYDITKGILDNLTARSDIFVYISYLKKQDDYTYAHCLNLSLLGNLFGKWLNMDQEDLTNLTAAGLLCDVGKTKVPADILNKKGKLSQDEYEKVKMHPVYGYEAIKDQALPQEVKLAVLQHHERIDGSGYPHGLKGNEFGRYARIFGICDVYAAMIADRPYRGKISPFSVIREFERDYYSTLDTEFLWVFLKNIAYNYRGRKVELKSGRIGNVMFINNADLSSPIVQLENGEAIDLMYKKDDSIIGLL
jgi:HD-GYP domain-containing protein (c-di-GMP phosphodiesterase class II)